MIVRELLTRLGFDADESKVRGFDGAVQALTISLTAVVGAATAASAAAFRLAQGAAAYGDEVAKTARQLGISGNALQEYRFAFDRLGVSEGEATSALERFSRAIGRAAEGSGTEADAFDRLGLSIRDTEGNLRPMEDLLPELADALSGIESEAERAAAAQDLLGRSGGRLAMALAEGGDEIMRLREEFRLLGGGLTEEQQGAAEEFTDAMTNLRTVLNGLRLQIGAELMPVFQPMIEAFTQFGVQNRELIMSTAARFFEQLAEVMGRLVGVARMVTDWIGRVASAVNNLSGFEKAALAVGLLLFSWQRLGKWFLAAGIVAILDDIAAWMNDQPSLIGRLFGPYAEFAESASSLVESLGGLENVIRGVMLLALAGWLMKIAVAARALAVSMGLVTAASAAAGAGAATAAGAGAAAAAAGASRASMFARMASRLGPVGLVAGAVAGVDALDRATAGDEGRQERIDRQIATGEALQGMAGGDGAGWNPLADAIEGRRQGPQSFDPSGITVTPSEPIEGAIDELRQYLDSLQGASIDVNDGSLMGDVDQSRTANISVQLSQSITVPPGTTAEQLAVIRRESDAAIERAAERAAAAMEM
jgi:hypothetical protein